MWNQSWRPAVSVVNLHDWQPTGLMLSKCASRKSLRDHLLLSASAIWSCADLGWWMDWMSREGCATECPKFLIPNVLSMIAVWFNPGNSIICVARPQTTLHLYSFWVWVLNLLYCLVQAEISQQLFDELLLNLVQAFVVPRGWIRGLMVHSSCWNTPPEVGFPTQSQRNPTKPDLRIQDGYYWQQ